MKVKSITNGFKSVTINAILLLAVIIYFIIKQFASPPWLKNLPVVAILILWAYNAWYIFNIISLKLRFGTIAKEITAFISILAGTWLGVYIINLLRISVFEIGDIKDTLIIAVIFNTVLSVIRIHNLKVASLLKQKEADNLKLKQAKTKAQLDLLYSKINPHFLYNSLNSIAGLAMIDGKKTKEMTIALSKLLHYTLNADDNNIATVEDEIKMMHTYFDIEKIRFGEKLNYEIHATEDVKNYIIPKFIFQPLIENAVIHALSEAEENNFVQMNVSLINKQLIVSIHDNGKQFPEKLIYGYGLKSVTERLDLLFPGKNEFLIYNEPKKFVKIIIKEPKRKK